MNRAAISLALALLGPCSVHARGMALLSPVPELKALAFSAPAARMPGRELTTQPLSSQPAPAPAAVEVDSPLRARAEVQRATHGPLPRIA